MKGVQKKKLIRASYKSDIDSYFRTPYILSEWIEVPALMTLVMRL